MESAALLHIASEAVQNLEETIKKTIHLSKKALMTEKLKRNIENLGKSHIDKQEKVVYNKCRNQSIKERIEIINGKEYSRNVRLDGV